MKNIVSAIGLLLIFFCTFGNAAEKKPPVYFVQISDTHYGKPVNQYRFREAIKIINDLPFDISCVIHTGDIASDQLYKEETGIAISNLVSQITKAPFFCVPGNHDFTFRGQYPSTNRYLEAVDVYKRYIGPVAQSFETNNVVFITLYTENLRKNLPEIEGYDALEWLENQLAAAGDKDVLIFTHAPEYEDFYNGAMHEGWDEEERAAWRKVLAKGNVKGIFCGHFHRDELHTNAEDGIPTFVIEPIADFWERQGIFRVYSYNNGKISYHTVYIDDPPKEARINSDGTLVSEEPN